MAFHPVQERDFPDDLKGKWRWIESQLKRYGPIMDGESVVEHTLHRIRNSTGQRVAQAIVELEYDLRTHKELRG
jgi:hypothetical protein